MLVAVSAALRIWLGRAVPTPWIAPDEMIYWLLGRTLYRAGRLAIEGAHSDYYSLLYPALIGGPLAWAGPERGYELAKALGAVAMSLAAVPAYLWARSVVSTRSALAVAALTLAIPAFSLAGLLMTETLFYPLAVAAAWAMARVLVEPTRRRQLLLVAAVAATALVRLQGIVLLAVFPTAALLSGSWRPARQRLVYAGFAGLVLAWAVFRLVHGGAALGAYTVAASGHYRVGAAARFVVYHLGDVVLITGLLPAGAAALLWFERSRLGREARAALAVATALSLWLVLQVGVFASRYVGHLAERDLIAAAPPLFLCLLVWLELGAPRTVRRSTAVALVALACVFAWPLRTLLTPDARPDNPSLLPIFRLVGGSSLGTKQLVVDGGLAVLALLLAAAPRRTLALAPLLLLALLGVGSIVAARDTASSARATRNSLLGAAPRWVDRAATGDVTMLYGGVSEWTVVWETLFWNRSVHTVLALPGARVIGPAPGGPASFDADGRVELDGKPVRTSAVVTPPALQIEGAAVATAAFGAGGTTVGNVLWSVDGPLRVLSLRAGFQTNGDVWSKATVHAFGCPGTLRLTLLPKQDERIELSRDGVLYRTVRASPPAILRLELPSPPGATGRCSFGISTSGKLLGSTLVAFEPQ